MQRSTSFRDAIIKQAGDHRMILRNSLEFYRDQFRPLHQDRTGIAFSFALQQRFDRVSH